MHEPPAPENPSRTPSTGRRLLGMAIPALVGAAAALGVLAVTGQLGGGDVTVIRESAPMATTASSPSDAAAVAEDAVQRGGALSVAEIVRRESPAVVLIEAKSDSGDGGLGSGFLIDRDGHILTNAHVVDGSDDTTVTFSDGTVEKARILGVDKSTDLAVIKIATVPAGIRPVPLGSSSGLVVGQEVVAIGNPYGLERTATTGIVSALERTIESPNGFAIQNAIQTDAAINQGNSGGPLFDRAGRVVGMNSQMASQNGGNVGLGFAVPIDTIRPIAQAVITGGRAEHAWIGISGRELTPAMAKQLDLTGRRGVVIAELVKDGPAAKAGLEAADDADATVPRGGDLIVAINGRPVQDMADVSRAVAGRQVGDSITVTVLRDGQEKTVTLRLEDRPASIGRG
ncbi:MAG: trypsin-like peptidase domain-containing protein [Acidobacteria bacterium]|nr:trypsin-like peptidase domain-containing protein [Acidobacteriota bacterium]